MFHSRDCLVGVLFAAMSVGCLVSVATAADAGTTSTNSGKLWVYLGTYTGKVSKGIYLSKLDLATGKLDTPVLAAEVANPSFLAIHPTQRFLYAVGEMSNFAGKKGGAVSALAIEPGTGTLKLLNQQSSRGAGPCHVTVDREGRCAIVSNYGSGSVACLPILPDGRLAEVTSFDQHTGSSVNPQRQAGPHAHSTNFDAAGRFAFTADLGTDKIMIYRFGAAKGQLTPNDPPSVSLPPGSGPRHFAFHPNGRWAYVINELKSTVTAFAYDPARGSLEAVQTVSTLPDDFVGQNTTAEIAVHPSGKFLYGSNRGHNSIAAFAIDAETGKLRFLGRESVQGKTPRNFAIDPTGSFLIAANQDTANVVVFRIDSVTGLLAPTGSKVSVSMPVCVRIMRPLEAAAPAGSVGTSRSFHGPTGLVTYSLRDLEKEQGVPAMLDKTKSYGFRYVEVGSTYGGMKEEEFKAQLDHHGLVPVGIHFPYDRIRDDIERVAAEAKVLGVTYVGCPWIPHKDRFDAKQCREAAAVFNRAGEALAGHGLKFFYHNHGYEFQPEGKGTIFDLLAAETNPKTVFFEMDVLWAVLPGQDPAALLKRYPDRWVLMHMKDLKKGVRLGSHTGSTSLTNDVAIGTGQVDWPKLLRAAQEVGIKYYLIEDESPSVIEQIPQSLRFLESVEW